MSLGIWQIALIILVLVLLFGAGKIPRLMADLAKGIKAFKQGVHDEETGPAKAAVRNTPNLGTVSPPVKKAAVPQKKASVVAASAKKAATPAPSKPSGAKKTAAKKPASKTAAAKKSATKRAVAKKPAPQKARVKKTPSKKVPAKKTSAKKV